ncbi:MAG: pyridoxal phosphate-dependent aminotransferase [Candidatus Chisholmbacteria bacterium]|nr:pyridoxal phosphate-dependent aminotransferase [Candidatus Chisholmbacteria bacterium]
MPIETIPYSEAQTNSPDLNGLLDVACSPEARSSAIRAMRELWTSKKTQKYFGDLVKLIDASPWKDSGFGTYFATVANMKTTYGLRVLPKVNAAFGSNWLNPVELGSGVGTIEPFPGFINLLSEGSNRPDLNTQYDSPGGTYPSRWAGATILNAKISPEVASDPVFTYKDTYITPSSTYAIDIAYEAFARLTQQEKLRNNRVVLVGTSYYVLALSAKDKMLPVSRVTAPYSGEAPRKFFPSPAELSANLPEDTGMIVLTLPNNPNGETYGNVELKQLFQLAKDRGIYILLDVVFDQLWFSEVNQDYANPLKMALEVGVLDQVIVVDGLSKSLNLAGERIGIVATKNAQLERLINSISISRLSNPSLTVEPLLQFEAISRVLDRFEVSRAPLEEFGSLLGTVRVRADLQKVTGSQWLEAFPDSQLISWYQKRQEWLAFAMKYYADNLTIIREILAGDKRRVVGSPDKAAYNTFIGFGETNQNAGFDKLLKLFLLTGIVAMSGQCFGLQSPEAEFWTRITYGGLSRKKLPEALTRLLGFLDLWDEMDLGNPQKFPVFDTKFPII